MNDVLATIVVCLMSDVLFRELPHHYHSNLDDQETDQSVEAESIRASSNFDPSESYTVYRELHSPEHIFADAFLLFEKVMDLGIKDLYFKGESL